MKKLLSPSVLSLLVGAAAMASVILCVMHIQYTRRIRSIQGTQMQLQAIQNNQRMVRALASDLYVYSKTNAAIKPLLDSIGIQPATP